jgi:hypothetical protein
MNSELTDLNRCLMDISLLMADGYKFLKFRAILEKWQREGATGNTDSQKLVDIVFQFERLLKAMDRA